MVLTEKSKQATTDKTLEQRPLSRLLIENPLDPAPVCLPACLLYQYISPARMLYCCLLHHRTTTTTIIIALPSPPGSVPIYLIAAFPRNTCVQYKVLLTLFPNLYTTHAHTDTLFTGIVLCLCSVYPENQDFFVPSFSFSPTTIQLLLRFLWPHYLICCVDGWNSPHTIRTQSNEIITFAAHL